VSGVGLQMLLKQPENQPHRVRVGVIPDYALSPDGRPCGTTIFYKPL
jgi:hypothetical protein